MQQSLKNKTIKGVGWSAIDAICSQGISFLVGVVLARLLTPKEFGTIGISLVFIALFNKIVDCGFSNALIRKQNVNDIEYSTTFVINFTLSLILYIICFFSAPFISSFFDNVLLTDVVRLLGIVLVINAFSMVQRTMLVKKIDFKTQAKVSFTASVISGVVGIFMAYRDCGVFSLVGQQLSRQFVNALLLGIVNKWNISIRFSYNIFKELFSYGSKLLLSGIVDTAFNELSTIVVGKIYSPATLGQYSRAKQFSCIFSSNVSSIMERVTFPVLSQIGEKKDLLIFNYRKIIKVLFLITSLGTVVIACCAKSIILILIGPKWTEAIVYLQMLAFVEITIPIKNVNLNLLQVYGRSDYILKLSVVKRIIELGAVGLGLISLECMLIGFAMAGILGFLLNAYATQIVSEYSVVSQVRDLIPSLVVAFIVGFIMYVIGVYIDNIYWALCFQIITGVISFLFISELLKLEEYQLIKNMFKEKVVGNIIKKEND